jgi:hypothetical protein
MTAAYGGASSSPPNGGGGGAPALLAEAQGTWASACPATTTGSWHSTLVISGASVTESHTDYTNGTCSGIGTTTIAGFTSITIGQAVTANLGVTVVTAYQIDYLSPGVTFYDLVYIDTTVTPNKFYIGQQTATLDGTSAAMRPTEVAHTMLFTRL